MLKDKDLFVSGTDESVIKPEELDALEAPQGGTETIPTPELATPEVKVEEPKLPEAPIEKPTNDVIPEWGTPPAEWEAKAPEKSVTEILDELEKSQIGQEEKTKEINKTAEEIKVDDTASNELKESVSKLQQQLLERDTDAKKSKIALDFLQEQVDSLYKENISYKFGRVDDDGVMSLINWDPNLKSIISQTIKTQDWKPEEKSRLVDLYKWQLEKLTWLDFTDFISTSKSKAEWQMSPSEDEVATNIDSGDKTESLFL